MNGRLIHLNTLLRDAKAKPKNTGNSSANAPPQLPIATLSLCHSARSVEMTLTELASVFASEPRTSLAKVLDASTHTSQSLAKETHQRDEKPAARLPRKVVGRKGDERMNKAVKIMKENPGMKPYEALTQGGFLYESDEPNCLEENDKVCLQQRKKNLRERLQKDFKRNNPSGTQGTDHDASASASSDGFIEKENCIGSSADTQREIQHLLQLPPVAAGYNKVQVDLGDSIDDEVEAEDQQDVEQAQDKQTPVLPVIIASLSHSAQAEGKTLEELLAIPIASLSRFAQAENKTLEKLVMLLASRTAILEKVVAEYRSKKTSLAVLSSDSRIKPLLGAGAGEGDVSLVDDLVNNSEGVDAIASSTGDCSSQSLAKDASCFDDVHDHRKSSRRSNIMKKRSSSLSESDDDSSFDYDYSSSSSTGSAAGISPDVQLRKKPYSRKKATAAAAAIEFRPTKKSPRLDISLEGETKNLLLPLPPRVAAVLPQRTTDSSPASASSDDDDDQLQDNLQSASADFVAPPKVETGSYRSNIDRISLANHSFLQAGTVGNPYWTCLLCRMVPLEFRSVGVVHYLRPQAQHLIEHRSICHRDGISLGSVNNAVRELCLEYNKDDNDNGKLDEAIRPLVEIVVGNDPDLTRLFLDCVSARGNSPQTLQTTTVETSGWWRRLPSSVDATCVQAAFEIFAVKLELSSSDLRDHPKIFRALEIMSPCFQVCLVDRNISAAADTDPHPVNDDARAVDVKLESSSETQPAEPADFDSSDDDSACGLNAREERQQIEKASFVIFRER